MATTIALITLLGPAAAQGRCEKENFAVAVDVGHSAHQTGSTSARGKSEHAFNDRLANEVVAQLQLSGFSQAFLLNPYGKELGLHERNKIADRNGADLFISIHHDSVQPHYLASWVHQGSDHHYCDLFEGFSLFVSGTSPHAARSQVTAKAIGRGMVKRGISPTLHHAEPISGESRALLDAGLGVYRRDTLAVLRNAGTPAVLVEAGVIVHRAEEARLEQAAHRAKIVAAIKEGVFAACTSAPRTR